MRTHLTTEEAAGLLGTDTWRVRRLFEDRTLPEPERFAGKRAIPREQLVVIIDALRARGWLPEANVAVADASQSAPGRPDRRERRRRSPGRPGNGSEAHTTTKAK